jgi:putative membrane protein
MACDSGLSASRPVSDQEAGSNAGRASESEVVLPPSASSAEGARTQREDEPDVRFTYANERTFLAWNRTALALIATGVAATQLLPKLQVEWGRRLLGLPLIALGALVAAESFRQWRANQRAMRRGDPLPRSWMPLVLTVGIVVIGAIAVLIAAFGTH